MTLLPAPLLLLIALRLRGSWRRFVRAARTPKGMIAVAFSLLFVALWIVPSLLGARARGPASTLVANEAAELAPFVILGLLLLSIVGSPGDRALAFLQAEVDLLFPAPFTRAQLLRYKLAQRFLPLLVTSLVFSLWTRTFAHHWIAAFLGTLLLFWFLNLAALCVSLAGQLLGERRFRLWRRLLVAALVAAVAFGAWWTARQENLDPFEAFKAFSASTAGQIVAAPALPFARTLSAVDVLGDLPLWAGVALTINVSLLLLATRLDANWLEASVESSRRLHERLERFRSSGGTSSRPARFASIRLAMLPRLRGFGPLLWRQLLTAFRGGMRALWIVALLIGVMVVPAVMGREKAEGWIRALGPMSMFMLAYLSLFLPQLLRADFRSDVDRMDVLKSLPVAPRAVAAAQVAAPALLVSALQWVLMALLAPLLDWGVDALPLWGLALLGLNLLNAALDAAAFLIWPQRMQTTPGMNFASGQMLVQLLKTFVLVLLLALAAGAGAVAGLATSGNWWAIAGAATTVLALEACGAIWIVGGLFARFDPSIERVAEG